MGRYVHNYTVWCILLAIKQGSKTMRETKFRVWDKEKAEWLSADYWFVRSHDSVLVIHPAVNNDSEISVSMETLGADKVTVVQYTGLKDARGREIYEGDIINDGGGAGIVEWCVGVAGFLVRPIKKSEHESYFLNRGDTTGPSQLLITDIVGNIYDNPELIAQP